MPMTPQEFLAQKFPEGFPDEFRLDRYMRGTEDSPSAYNEYLSQVNEQMFPQITDPYGNIWVTGSGYRLNSGDEDSPGYELAGGADSSDYMQSQYADLVQGLTFKNEYGATYIPQIIANQIAARSHSGGGFIKNWLNGPGPVMALISLFTAGAASGFGAAGAAAGAAGGGTVTGSGGLGLSAADALGLQQMGIAAGLPAGSTALDAFIASGGTMGSTAAGGLGSAATLAESFGYTTPTVASTEIAGTNWWDVAKTIGKAFGSNLTSGLGSPDVVPLDIGGADSADASVSDALVGAGAGAVTGTAAAATGTQNPVIEDTSAAAPKPGAPNYQELWENYAGWMENINRINEGAFSDVRARLSAAGAAPDLIKMQTEHLESQRLGSIESINKSETFSLLEEGYGIAMGTIENRYEGGMGKYAGAGKPELMDFYTELYGQPARGAGAGGTIGTGGTPSTSGQTAANPWFEEPGKISLIG